MATIYQPDKEEEEKGALTQTGGIAGTTATPSQASTAPKPKGSGRFTNIQKYLQANQQGGQQVAQGIGKGIQGDISKEREQAQDYYSGIREGVEKAQGVAQAGGQYLQQLQGIGQNIQQATGADQLANRGQDVGAQALVQQPQFSQYQDIQAGRGIDENLLASQQAELSGAAQKYLGTSQQALEQLGSEGGRFGLLRKTFGGDVNPQYSTGQQRLDQLFLAKQGLQPLQQSVRGDVQAASALTKQVGQTGADVGRVIGQERQLVGDIGQQAAANEQAYLDMLSSYVPEINKLREQKYTSAQEAFKSPNQLTAEQLAGLGVGSGDKIYDVLDNINFEDVAVKGRQAGGVQDVATQADVNRYQALSQLAGISPEQQRLTQAGDLGAAFTAEQGDKALSSRLQVRGDELKQQGQQTINALVAARDATDSGGDDHWANKFSQFKDPREFMEFAKNDRVAQSYMRDVNEMRRYGIEPTHPITKAVANIMDQAKTMDLDRRTFSDSTGKRYAIGSGSPGSIVNKFPIKK